MNRNRILKSTSSHPVFRIKERLENFETIKLMKLFNNLESMFKQEIPYGEVGEFLKICLVLTKEDGSALWNFFEGEFFIQKLKNGDFQENNAVLIRCNGEVIKVYEKRINDIVDASSFSKELKEFPLIFIDYRTFTFFINGECIYYIRDIIYEKRVGIVTRRDLPAREYRKLIENHYNEVVYGERGFKYWENKPKRLLKHPPEIIFHKPLWWYLNNYVSDGKVDPGVDIGGTSDRTDIRIISFEAGEIYIIEIKCLGRCNENNQENADYWANIGIQQLVEYLNEEEDSKIGLLVLYDGRKKDREINWIARKEWHEKIDPYPMRFYLISEPASVRAKNKLREIKAELNEKRDKN